MWTRLGKNEDQAMYQSKKKNENLFIQAPAAAMGNQQLLQLFQMEGDCSNIERASVIQREVTGVGEQRSQYYTQQTRFIQNKDNPLMSSLTPYGPAQLTDEATYLENAASNLPVAKEDGYESFQSDQPANSYSKVFLVEQETDQGYIYMKTLFPPKLPVSCIEAAEWAIHLMAVDKQRENMRPPFIDGDYPGYMNFPEWVYNFDLIYLDSALPALFAAVPGQVAEFRDALLHEGEGEDPLDTVKNFLARKTSVKVIGRPGYGKGRESVACNLDSQPLNRQMTRGIKSYEGNFTTGDGILVTRNIDDERIMFHAVAIIADFPCGSMIVLERNAETMLLDTMDCGDTNWLMNTYPSKDDFLNSVYKGVNPEFIKLFKLEIRN